MQPSPHLRVSRTVPISTEYPTAIIARPTEISDVHLTRNSLVQMSFRCIRKLLFNPLIFFYRTPPGAGVCDIVDYKPCAGDVTNDPIIVSLHNF